jgi:hypothetical protein
MRNLFVEGTFDQNLEPLDPSTIARQAQLLLSLLNPLLRSPLRTFYRTRRPVDFSFTYGSQYFSGTIPQGFICDGFTIPVYGFVQTATDRLLWRYWLVHDYLVTERPLWVNGTLRKPTLAEITSVLFQPAGLFLNLFPLFLTYTRQRQGFKALSAERDQVLSNAYLSTMLLQ